MTAPTDRTEQPRHAVTGPYANGDHPTGTHPMAAHPTGPFDAAPPVEKQPRTITVRLAAIIAVVTFVLGLGLSMLIGPLGGPPSGGPAGPGGQGAPGTSQTTQGTTGSGTTGT